MLPPPPPAKRAFSLVELAIVLVILGLLAGGVLSGSSLIRAAELRGVVTDVQKLQATTYSFRDKYFAIPGDMPNAQAFWGPWVSSATPADVTGAKNGNGDGWIGMSGNGSERFDFFRHLALAGLIEGSYAGSYADTATPYTSGVTTPPAKMGGKSSLFVNSHFANSATTKIYGTQGNYFQVQAFTAPYSNISPEEAWSIDKKIDDGKSSSGAMMALSEAAVADRKCSTNDDFLNAAEGSADYRLGVTSKECWMLFWLK